jgi:hypothetical protein
MYCCHMGAGWTSAGRRGADAERAYPEEVLSGGDQRASWGMYSWLSVATGVGYGRLFLRTQTILLVMS